MQDKAWANDQLRYAIEVLQGKNVVARATVRIQIALIIKENLLDEGFWWQVGILEIWLCRFLKRGVYSCVAADSPMRGEGTHDVVRVE
jgi:hypothetical protein